MSFIIYITFLNPNLIITFFIKKTVRVLFITKKVKILNKYIYFTNIILKLKLFDKVWVNPT